MTRVFSGISGSARECASRTASGGFFRAQLAPVVAELSGIPADKKVDEVTKEQRRELGRLLKGLTVHIRGFRPVEEAIVTRGGVSVKEINPNTMESRLCPGLYFAGEIIDCDGYTGGFNLQIAFATAYSAGTRCFAGVNFPTGNRHLRQFFSLFA